MRVSFQKAYQAFLGPSLVKIGRKFKQETGCYWVLDMMPVLNFDSYHTQRQQECDKIEHLTKFSKIKVLFTLKNRAQACLSENFICVCQVLKNDILKMVD